MAVSGNYTAIVQVKVSDTDLQKQLKTVGSKTTIDIKVNADTKAIDNLKTSINDISESAKQYSSNSSSANQANEKLATTADKASKSTNALAGYLERTKKVFDFGLSTASLGLLYGAINEAKDAIIEFDGELTNFKKVSDLSGESLDAYTQKLGEIGLEVGRTRAEMVSASAEFKKSGFTEEESAQLAKVAALYQNVADSQLSAGDASAYVISQMKAFNISVDEAQSIIDKTNEVSNRFSVSSTDISSALTKTSGAMATYGNTIDETIAMTVAGTEILTGQAGKVSRGLRSIGAEIVKLANEAGEFSYQVNGATKTLELFDEQGKMLSTFDVLSKLAEDWKQMSEAEQSNVALTIGMKTQVDVLSATLMNFDSALEATTVAQESQGSAMKENEAYMESLAA